jgi:uncharacterized protein (TIGR00251 family)
VGDLGRFFIARMTEAQTAAFLKDGKAGCTLSIKVIPRASKDEIVGEGPGELKVRLKAPPVDGAANEALVRFMSGKLKVPKSSIELVSGHTSRHKVIRILRARASEIRELLIQ